MLEEFKKYITDQNLFTPSDPILLAVSGGIDSVAMTELFHRAGFKFGIAHCNFGLRGKESDEDEVFVGKLAEKYEVPFFTKRFLTTKVTKDTKGRSDQEERSPPHGLIRFVLFVVFVVKSRFRE